MEELRRLRKERGLTQAKLAVQAGLDPSSLSQIETGARRPNTRTLEKLAGVLGVEVADLFPKVQSPLPDFEVERREATDVVIEAARQQAAQDRQAAARAFESERPQTYFKRHENEALQRLLQYPADELAGALLTLALRIVWLEEALPDSSTSLSVEDFPAEQVAAFLAENEHDNERIKQELAKLTPGEIKERIFADPPSRRIRDAYAETERRRTRDRAKPEAC